MIARLTWHLSISMLLQSIQGIRISLQLQDRMNILAFTIFANISGMAQLILVPPHLICDDQVGITGLAFSDKSELLVSYNDEFIYLFTRDMGLGPNPVPSSPLSACNEASEMGFDHSAMHANDKAVPQVYKGHRNCETVKGVSFFGPKSDYVVSGSDCGHIFIWKKKGRELIRVMEADKDVVNCIKSHPHTTVLASSGIESDIKIWTPKGIDKPTLPINVEQVAHDIKSFCFISMLLTRGKRWKHRHPSLLLIFPRDIYDLVLDIEFKPKPRGWMHRFASPKDLMLHLFSMRRWDSSPERNRENSSSFASQELLQLIWAFNANGNASDDSGNASGPEDLFC